MNIKNLKMIPLAIFFPFLFAGCTNNLSKEDSEKLIHPEIQSYFYSKTENLKAYNSEHKVTFISTSGTVKTNSRIPFLDIFYVDINCKTDYQLSKDDVSDSADIGDRLLGFNQYTLINKEKLKPIYECIDNLIENETIDKDYILQIINDSRIKQYRSDKELNKILIDSLSDDKVTYAELINIFTSLDKSIENKNNKDISLFKDNIDK